MTRATPFALRPASEADLPFAFALYGELMHDLTLPHRPWNEAGQRRTVSDGIASGNVRIVLVDGEPVGWIQVNPRSDALELGQLYVSPGWHGRGIGTRLVREVQDRAREAAKGVVLSVLTNNPRAHALYSRLGFVEVGRDAVKVHLAWSP